jgi:hypothetical protein
MGVITMLMDRVTRFVLDNTIKERKFKATGDNTWFDRLSLRRFLLSEAFCQASELLR